MNPTQTLYSPGGNSPASSPASHPSSLFPQINNCRTIRDLSQIHAVFIKSGQMQDTLAAAEILRFCATSDLHHRDLDYAHKIFNQMPQRNCFSWNTIIRGFSESDDKALIAITLFYEMMSDESVEPNRFTIPSVLKACAKTGKIHEGKQIHGLALKYGFGGDEFVMSNLVRMYVMCGFMKDACVLFYKNIIEKDMVVVLPGGVDSHIVRLDDRKYGVKVLKDSEHTIHPSVDELFLSALKATKRLAGVVLSGMGDDGMVGAIEMNKYGLPVIVQEEESCVVYGMPRAIVEAGVASEELNVLDISKNINRWFSSREFNSTAVNGIV